MCCVQEFGLSFHRYWEATEMLYGLNTMTGSDFYFFLGGGAVTDMSIYTKIDQLD